ncbi:MAG TPA: hypothetical protein VFA12_06060 [Stellaceae bacterium]|nr:hypothetical protein [Stellaceae bacterium]
MAFAVVVAGLEPVPVLAQHRHQMPGMPMEETKSAAPYHPHLGELMTAFVQPRHTKLGLAGEAQNWAYAAYELDELREAFGDIETLVPKHGDLSIPEAVGATVKQPLEALAAAIAAKDAAAFNQAYAALTDGCNACHRSAGHAMIVIQVPRASPYPDQDFRPQAK